MMDATKAKQQKHFVLVHGACHGAWSWYKLKPLLEAAGHRATAVELSASGIDTKTIHEVHTLKDYSAPLMELLATIPQDDKVVLVGHSFGGLSLGLAMEHYPEKISIAVFLAAFVPDSDHAPSYPIEKYFERYKIEFMPIQKKIESMLDTEFQSYGSPEEPETSMLFGPQFLSFKAYQNCSPSVSPVVVALILEAETCKSNLILEFQIYIVPQDLALAKMLIRPGSLFLQDLTKARKFSTERFGSVKRAYILSNEDKTIPAEFQRWLIQEIGMAYVEEIKDADHMAMLSKPEEVCQCLLNIAAHH